MVLFCVSAVLAVPVYLLFGVLWFIKRSRRRLREYYDSIETEDL
jgi:hypothetical protein